MGTVKMSFNLPLQPSALAGSWRLLSWTIDYSDGRPGSMPYGENPSGLIVYSDDGWMSAAIARAERPALEPGVGLRQQTDEVLAEVYRSYFHYAGHYRIEGRSVFHTVTHSLNPDFVGTEQERAIELNEPDLVLSGHDTIGKVRRTHRLHWRRVTASN